LGKIPDSLNFLWKRGDAITINVMSEEVQVTDTEKALVGIDDDAMGGESFENSSQVLEVLLRCGAGNEDVINVDIC